MRSTDTDPSERVRADRPNSARVWDALLGGKDNFAADREVRDLLRKADPGIRQIAYDSNAFRVHAVEQLVAAGVSQFIDCGPGVPDLGTMTNEIAQRRNPDARVAYVDLDPVVLVHAQGLLADDHRTRVIEADIFDPKSLLARRDVEEFFDLRRPVALIHTMTLGHCPDELDPAEVMTTYMEFLPPGSYSVISHCVEPAGRQEHIELLQQPLFVEAFGTRWFRPIDDLQRLFTGQHLVHPGLAPAVAWLEDISPLTEASQEFIACGIGCTDAAGAERLSTQIDLEPQGSLRPRIPRRR